MRLRKRSVILTISSLLIVAAFSIVIVVTAQQHQTTTQKTRTAPTEMPAPGKQLIDNFAVRQTKESQKAMTPQRDFHLLKDGNERLVSGGMVYRDLRAQIKKTSEGQYPFAMADCPGR